MSHWHVVVTSSQELHGQRRYAVRELARAELEQQLERQAGRTAHIENCDESCLGDFQPKVKV